MAPQLVTVPVPLQVGRGVVGTIADGKRVRRAVCNHARLFGAVAEFRTIEEKQELDRLDVARLADSDAKSFADVDLIAGSATAHAKSGDAMERSSP